MKVARAGELNKFASDVENPALLRCVENASEKIAKIEHLPVRIAVVPVTTGYNS